MKTSLNWVLAYTLLTIIFVSSCQERLSVAPFAPVQISDKQSNILKNEFATVLAKALIDKKVRDFIKNESLKQFDGDYDILYAVIKDKMFQDGKTFEQYLSQYASSSDILSKLSSVPLLTIFVPTLAKFSPQTWDVNSQIPIVASLSSDQIETSGNRIMAFSQNGESYTLTTKDDPNRPVIVIKNNERLVAQSLNSNARQISPAEALGGEVFMATNNYKYYFIGDVFHKNKPNARALADYTTPDQSVIYAFDQNLESHRDYVYYGINPPQGVNQGSFKRNYCEFLEKIRFENLNALQNVTGDWTEGNLEFRFTLLWIDRNGTPQSDPKVFYCNSTDLYYLDQNGNKQIADYHPHVQLRPWDMQAYGDEWKINIYEYDPNGTITKSESTESTFGFNFEGDFTILKKGIKFGVNGTIKNSSSTTIQTATAPNELGSANFYFYDPIIVHRVYQNFFNVYEKGTGSVLLSLEPFTTY